MIKLCIFDMDGTLVNSIISISYFANKALNKYGLCSIETERYKKLVGNGAANLVRKMIDCTGGSDEQFELVRREYVDTYDNDFLYLTEPYEGILDMLKALKERGIKTAIISNKPNSTTQKISAALFGDSLIDVCYGSREKIKLKPDPQAVNMIIDEFKVKKDECLYIGDSATDIETAKNAFLTSIGVLWGFRDIDELKLAGADHIVSSPCEIVQIADRL